MADDPTAKCRYCFDTIEFNVALCDWVDPFGNASCPPSESGRHYPVNPVEGIDY